MLAGKIATLLVIATVMALIASLWVAWRYRVAMQHFMKFGQNFRLTVDTDLAPRRLPSAADLPPIPIDLTTNDRAWQRMLGAFVALTLLMALTRTLLTQFAADGPITLKTVGTLGLAYAWPVVPVIAVVQRWPRWRLVGALTLWFVAAVALLSWRTTEAVSFAQVFGWMLIDIGLPLIVVTALCLGGATRAIGPWLVPLFALLCATSQAGVDLLGELIARDSPVLHWLVGWLPAFGAIALFALLPWLLAWWPARAMGCWLAAAYRRRQISELLYLFTAVWAIALVGPALGAIASGDHRFWLYALPLAWIPLGARLMQSINAPPPGRPPTLLVLRVFQQDANIQDLFDRVVERWRLTGNSVLIAGTDLAERTIDPDDIFTFLDGRLGERFILREADIAPRLAAFEWQPDVEGRYRINECYCHDTTWKAALAELLRLADVVLMDLRNFKASNAGCLHELRELAAQPGLRRVVVLTNRDTDLEAARAAAQSPDGRFVWLQPAGDAPPSARFVLNSLLGT